MMDDPKVTRCVVWLCDMCLDGKGGICNVPGCFLCRSTAPDIPIRQIVEIETAALAAREPRIATLEAALRDVEWGNEHLYGDDLRLFCPWCHGEHGDGHRKGCKLSDLIAGSVEEGRG